MSHDTEETLSRLYLSPECLLNFLSKSYFPLCKKSFQVYGVLIPRKCIDMRHFYSCPSPLKTRPQVLAITPYAGENYSLPQVVFFRKSVPPQTAERGGGNYDLFCQNSVRKYENDLEH